MYMLKHIDLNNNIMFNFERINNKLKYMTLYKCDWNIFNNK